jgi:hypothetical protein
MLWVEKNFLEFHIDADSFYWCKTSILKRALALMEVTNTWLGNEQAQVGYSIKINDTWALTKQTSYMKALAKLQQYGSMIDVKQGVHFVGSGWYASLLKKVKQGFKRTREAFNHWY